MTRAARELAERLDELAVLDDAMVSACSGEGAIVTVEGPPGIRKTELLDAATARVAQRSMLVLTARASELEFSHAYAVVRQLFEPA